MKVDKRSRNPKVTDTVVVMDHLKPNTNSDSNINFNTNTNSNTNTNTNTNINININSNSNTNANANANANAPPKHRKQGSIDHVSSEESEEPPVTDSFYRHAIIVEEAREHGDELNNNTEVPGEGPPQDASAKTEIGAGTNTDPLQRNKEDRGNGDGN
ncbi:hypothetical protein RFI_08697, partial [Reticulomyxa filosa]